MIPDNKIITAPDLEHSNMMKVMLVDFDWREAELFASISRRSPVPLVIYVYNQTEDDHAWCLTAARQSDSVLVNCVNRTPLEMLKGYLLSLPQAVAYGKNDNSFMARITHHDISIWFTEVIKYYTSPTRGKDGGIQ
jgi:hypothetical protein